MKKWILILLLALSICQLSYTAHTKDRAPANTLVIMPNDHNGMSDHAFNVALENVAEHLEKEGLGTLRGKVIVRIIPANAVKPSYGPASWPDFAPYQEAVHNLFLELGHLKKTKEFAAQGLRCRAALQWETKRQATEKKFTGAKLPSFAEYGFEDLKILAGAYAKMRSNLSSPAELNFLEEAMYAARSNLNAIIEAPTE